MKFTSARMRSFLSGTGLCAVLVLSHPAFAQDAALPGSADPGRALGDLRIPDARPDTTLQPAEETKRAVPLASEGMQDVKFVLHSIALDGMTAYDLSEIRPIYEPHLQQEISVQTLLKIMAQIQQKYLDDGYALTKVVIPNQDIQNGDVRFTVIEGYVARVDIGPEIKQSPAVLDAAAIIGNMRPLNIKKLERIMLLLNDLPESNVSAILASPDESMRHDPGAVRLVLKGNEEKETIGSIGMDNHGSVFTGPWQVNANYRARGLLFDHSALDISAFSAIPFQEQKIGSVSYSVPMFGISGVDFKIAASKARTEPGSSLSLLDIKGASESVEATVSYSVIRQRNMTLRTDAGFEWKNSRTKILGEELYDDRLRIAKLGARFNFSDSWAGFNVLDVRYSQGLNVFGVREAGSVDLSRQDGRPDFRKYEFLAARLQGLPHNFEFLGLVKGQYSHHPLLSSEEFGFGGAQIGRGYDSSEITGDRGIAASLELRYKTNFNAWGAQVDLQPYAFYDMGKIWNIDEGAKTNISAASAGIGVRTSFGDGWNADLNLARPLTKSADNEPKYQNDLGARVLFSISKSF